MRSLPRVDGASRARILLTVVLLLSAISVVNLPAGADPDLPEPPPGTIAFVSERTGADELYVMDVDGSDVTRLTDNDGFDRAPAWSPDGTELVFNSRREPHADRPQIYRVTVTDPGGATRVTTSDTEDLRASWYPDGAAIVFQRGGFADGPDLIRHDLDTGEETALTMTDAFDAAAVVSPDGALIAFQTNRDLDEGFFPFRLALLALASGEVVTIPVSEDEQDGSDDGPTWSPDGTQLAFARSGSLRLFDFATGETTVLTDGDEFDVSPDFSPDGEWLVFQSDRVDEDGGIHLLHLDTETISYVGEGRTPVWTATVRSDEDPIDDAPEPPEQPEQPATVSMFTDVPEDSVHARAIGVLAEAGIVRGTTPTTFEPDRLVRRDQTASLLARALDLETPDVEVSPFADVPIDNVHAGAIAALVAEGVIEGIDAESFAPAAAVTRAQMASLLTRGLGLEVPTDPKLPFVDVDAGSVHAPAIAALLTAGVTGGVTATTFEPGEPVTRAQLATFLARGLGLVPAFVPAEPLVVDDFTVADGPTELTDASVGVVDDNGQPGVQRPVVDPDILGGERDAQFWIGSSDQADQTWSFGVDPERGLYWETDPGLHVNMTLEWDGSGDGTTFGPAVPPEPIELDLRAYSGVRLAFAHSTENLEAFVQLGRRGDDSPCGEACGFAAALSQSEVVLVPGGRQEAFEIVVPLAGLDAPFAPGLPGVDLGQVGSLIVSVRSAPGTAGNDLVLREVALVP